MCCGHKLLRRLIVAHPDLLVTIITNSFQIKTIIKQGVDAPEGENSLKKLQLRELAALNGTLRDEEIIRCRNCGSSEHKHWECPEQPNFTATLTCTKCGSSGHIAMDCTVTQKE